MRTFSVVLIALFLIFSMSYSQNVSALQAFSSAITPDEKKETPKIIYLDREKFKKMIFNYETEKEWKYLGGKPAIIDFYADWCGPCRMVAPTLEELQKEYGNKIQIYKVNTQYEQELAAIFGITGIPAFLFIPVEGTPTMGTGAMPKQAFEEYINKILKVSK
ncbi:MAG: thioredoxin [Marinilabiliales bacterium]